MINPLKARKLAGRDHIDDFLCAQNELSDQPVAVLEVKKTDRYRSSHTVEGGIERVQFIPSKSRGTPPVLLQHGMWHNSNCWRRWQEILAQNGIESTAYSLPGHGLSPEQRPVAECSLAYYLRFLANEVARLPQRPVLVGHSMGGALVQWYIKYNHEPLAAAFVASWTSKDILKDCLKSAMRIDPLGTLLSPFLGWKYQFRSETVVQKWFLSKEGYLAASDLKRQLGPESEIVLLQHRPPMWTPPLSSKCAKLWMVAEKDAIIPPAASVKSGNELNAKIVKVAAGHDIMLDTAAETSALQLVQWMTDLKATM